MNSLPHGEIDSEEVGASLQDNDESDDPDADLGLDKQNSPEDLLRPALWAVDKILRTTNP